MNVWSNSQPVSRYVNHTSPTRHLAHFPQLSHELSPATGPYKRPQPATISLPRCDCNLGHTLTLLGGLYPTYFFRPSATPAPGIGLQSHILTASSLPLPGACDGPGDRFTRDSSPHDEQAHLERMCDRQAMGNSRAREPHSRGTKPLPRFQNKALGVDSTPLPDASAQELVAVRLWRRQRIRKWNLPHAERGGTRPSRPRRQG